MASVLVKFLGDASDLKRAAADGGQSIDKFGNEATRAALGLDTVGSASGRTGLLARAAGEDFGKLASQVGAVSPTLGNAASGFQTIAGRMSAAQVGALGVGAGAAAAGVAIGKLALDGAQNFVNLAGEIRNVQRLSGTTAEDASRLADLFDTLGVDVNTGANAFFKMSQNIANNEEKFRAHGITVQRDKDGNVDLMATLLEVADAYDEAGAGAEGNKIVMDAFGRSGAALIPILAKGKQGLRDFFAETDKNHEILSQKDLDQAREYELAMHELGDAASGLQRELGKGLVPTLTNAALAGTKALESIDSLLGPMGGLEAAVRSTVQASGPLGNALIAAFSAGELFLGKSIEIGENQPLLPIKDMADALDDEAGAADTAARAVGDVSTSHDRLNDALDASDDKVKDLRSSQDEANDSFDRATGKVKDYETALWDAGEALNEALKPASAGDVEGAALGVERALDRQNDAVTSLSEAERELNRLRRHGGSREEIARAEDAVAAAKDRHREANERLAEAEAKVAEATARLEAARRGGATPAEIAAADEKVADAKRKQRDATERLADAEERLKDAKPEDQAREQRAVRDATEALADANKDLAAAQTARANVAAPDPREIAAAEDAVNDALGRQEAAQDSVREATTRLRDARRELHDLKAPASEDEIRRATEKVEDAQRDLREATLGVNEATERQNEIARQGTEADERVVEARRNVRRAEDDLAEAQRVATYWAAVRRNAEKEVNDELERRSRIIDRSTDFGSADSLERRGGGTSVTNHITVNGVMARDKQQFKDAVVEAIVEARRGGVPGI